MSEPTITFEIDGQTVKSSDAMWYVMAPCGCIEGALVVDLGDPKYQYRAVLTEADAWAEFYKGQAERRRRHVAAGFTVRLGRRGEVATWDNCPHVPKWGLPPEPTLDGYLWATTSRFPADAERRHLVAVEHISTAEDMRLGKLAALCGRGEYRWVTGDFTRRALTCRRCEGKARKAGAR